MSNDNEKVLKDKNTDAVADYVRGERFQFQNFGAECEIDTFHDYKGKAHYIVNVKSNSRKNHTYVYSPKDGGLIGFYEKNNTLIKDRVPFDDFLALGDYDEEYPMRIQKYVKKYGFFWPISEQKYVRYDLEKIFFSLQPLRRLHELMEELTVPANLIDYERLFKLTFFFVFLKRPSFEYEMYPSEGYGKMENRDWDQRSDKKEMEFCSYSFCRAWWPPAYVAPEPNLYKYQRENMSISDATTEYKFILPNGEVIEASSKDAEHACQDVKNDDNEELFCINDTFLGEYAFLRKRDWEDYIQDRLKLYKFQNSSEMISWRLNSLYLSLPQSDIEARSIIDFLFHFNNNVSRIEDISLDGIIDINDNLYRNKAFDKKYKSALLRLAKMVCKKELNWGIKDIHPVCDIERLRPDWKIPDLISALYFSHFYSNPEFVIYRKCENPTCSKYFRVLRTNDKQKYCSKECSNQVAQKLYRQRKLLEKAKENENII